MVDFIMLVGISGSGKTSKANDIGYDLYGNKCSIFSVEKYRKRLLGDENNQSKDNYIFRQIQKQIIKDLKRGVSVIYDATNLTIKSRKIILQEVSKVNNCKKIAWIFCTPFSQCVYNINKKMPKKILEKQRASFQIPLYSEGFDYIEFENYINRDCRPQINEVIKMLEDSDLINEGSTQGAIMRDVGKLFNKQNYTNIGAHYLLQFYKGFRTKSIKDFVDMIALINYQTNLKKK